MKSGTNTQGNMHSSTYIYKKKNTHTHTRSVLIPQEAFTNCQLSIIWLIKCGAQNASWILINVFNNKTLRSNGHWMRGTEQKKKEKNGESQTAALHYLQQFSSLFFTINVSNDVHPVMCDSTHFLKPKAHPNTWIWWTTLSLFVSLNSIVLMLYFDFIYFGSPRGDPLSWRTVLYGAVGLTIRELCSMLWEDMFTQHPWFMVHESVSALKNRETF